MIDSKKKFNGTNNNFTIYLNQYIHIKEYIKLNYLSFPRLNYLINDRNNKMRIIFIQNTIEIPFLITFENQVYTPENLANYITTKINYLSNNNYNFVCIYDKFKYKFSFSANTKYIIDFTYENELNKLFSMDKIKYPCDNLNNLITNIIDFNNIYYLQLSLTNIPSNNFIDLNLNTNCNFIIPLISTNFSEIFQYKSVDYDDIRIRVNDYKTNLINVQLLDDTNNLFDNNNGNIFFILEYV